MAKLLTIKLFSVFICLASAIHAQWDWRGHNRVIATSFHGVGAGPLDYSFGQAVLNHRSTLLYVNGNSQFEVAYELFPSVNDGFSTNANAKFSYRGSDLNYYLAKSSDNRYVVQNLDRFFYTYSSDVMEINIGRQPISFGSSRSLNPLDVLVPFDFTVINIEQRLGVDAYRFKVPFSDMGMVEFGGTESEDLNFKNEYRFLSLLYQDVRLLYQEIRQHRIWGLDIQQNIGDWGTWLELGHFEMNQQENFLRYTVGGQYHFEGDISLFFEYHQNGAGALNNDVSIFVSNRDYLNVGGSFLITPIETINLTLINDINTPSSLINLIYEKNFLENWYATIGTFYNLGNRARSEFGSYPKIFYATLKNFF